MVTMAEIVIAAGWKLVPLMLEYKGMFIDSWKIDPVILYIRRQREWVNVIQSQSTSVLFNSNDIKAVNILLLIFPVDIYTLIIPTISNCKSNYRDGLRTYGRPQRDDPQTRTLINDMRMIPMTMSPMKINTKFVNHLQPEWSSYSPIVVQQPPTFQPDTGLAIPNFLPTDDPIKSLNKDMIFLSSVYCSKFHPTNKQLRTSSNPIAQATIHNGQVTVQNVQGRQSQGYAGNAGNNQASGARVINTVGNAGANQPRVIICYNCNGKGHIAKQCTTRKKVKDSRWFKEKMLIAQAQEAGVVLNKEQQDFLADSLEETDDYYDDEATANVIFLENLSTVGPINNDTIEPRYDSDIHCKVPHYDTYHDSDMLNSNILELGYIENIVSYNESYDELTGNNNVISYTDYMLTIGNNKDNYVPPSVQKNDMMLSVIEQMKSQVENCNMVNQESKSVNESLTSELERYKDRVRVLEYAVKDGHSEQEAYLNLLTKFDECIKRKTTLSPHQIGSLEQLDIKGAFKKDVIPFSENLKETFKLFEKGFITKVKEIKDIFKQMEDEVDQCSMAKKSFEIEKKQLLINNDQLLEENITSDIMCTYLRSLNEVDNCGKCKSFDIVLLDLQESNKSLCESRKRFAKLENTTLLLISLFKIIKNK
ncbi:retrovirus-related pol polyprotein from transposon TNT 1-94 [Tanacetum coccineum]